MRKTEQIFNMENSTEDLNENPPVRLEKNPSSDGRSTRLAGLPGLAGLAALPAAQRALH